MEGMRLSTDRFHEAMEIRLQALEQRVDGTAVGVKQGMESDIKQLRKETVRGYQALESKLERTTAHAKTFFNIVIKLNDLRSAAQAPPPPKGYLADVSPAPED